MRFSGKEVAGLALAQEKTTGYPGTVFAARLTDSEAIVEDFMRINPIIDGAKKMMPPAVVSKGWRYGRLQEKTRGNQTQRTNNKAITKEEEETSGKA